ncbi:MAG: hypothetical protein H0W74_05900 [Sphingosinicella sp.]|nr:hypothetical protein [Sphingosinicella sp.]
MQGPATHIGRRARQLVPGLAVQATAMTLAQSGSLFADDVKLFTTSLAGGLVFFGTFFS